MKYVTHTREYGGRKQERFEVDCPHTPIESVQQAARIALETQKRVTVENDEGGIVFDSAVMGSLSLMYIAGVV